MHLGCEWYVEWKANVDRAHSLGQRLVVVYKDGWLDLHPDGGAAEVPWAELCQHGGYGGLKKHGDDDAGLGTSQKGDVAYIKSRGYPFARRGIYDDAAT